MAHESLESYYKINFALVQHHKYSITELESLYPFERDIYFDMLVEHVKEVQEEQQRHQ